MSSRKVNLVVNSVTHDKGEIILDVSLRVSVESVYFSKSSKPGDYLYMLGLFQHVILGKESYDKIDKQDDDFKYSLFIYNENYEQFKDKYDIRKGGGNACVRMIRSDYPEATEADKKRKSFFLDKGRAALGIPTGYNTIMGGFNHINLKVDGKPVKEMIDESIEQIVMFLVSNPQFDTVYYTREDEDDVDSGLGASLFSPHQSVLNYITDKIKLIPYEVAKRV
tara:strand:+ start:11 stop:679 length:669 start_codon:yes stop_codon:yes gene_type:complete